MNSILTINPANYGRNSAFRPPFGLMTISSKFKQLGVNNTFIDIDILRLKNNKEDIFKLIKKHSNVDLIVIGGMHTSYASVKEIFSFFKTGNIDTPTILGGRIASSLNYLLWEKIPNLKLMCTQEGEKVIESIYNNFPKIHQSEGVNYRDGNKIIINTPAPIISTLDDNPPMPWNMLNSRYYSGNAYLYGSIGCPGKCTFCRRSDSKCVAIRRYSVKKIIDNVKYFIEKYNMKYFVFVDEFFISRKSWALEFFEEIKKLNIHWECSSRADCISEKDKDFLIEMKRSGCEMINFGLESGSQEILTRMKKNITISQMEEAIVTVRKSGIRVKYTFIYGHPGETKETALESIKWREKMGLGGSYFYATPYPGTDLWTMFREKAKLNLNDEEKYILSNPTILKPTLNLSEMSNNEFVEVNNICKKKLARIGTRI